MRIADYDLALVLGGGAALGAYQGGAYQALHEAGLRPRQVAGTSIGAFNGVLIAGNRPEDRVERLRAFWDRVGEQAGGLRYGSVPGSARRLEARASSLRTRLLGRPRFHQPQLLEALAPVPAWRSPGLYDLRPALATLGGLARLPGPGADTALTVHATDLVTGQAARFDSREQQLGPEHVLASSSLLPDYPPTELDGRLLCDGAFSENLPLRAALGRLPDRPLLCIAVDLVSAAGQPRWSLDGMAERQQDLLLAAQTAHLIEAVKAELALAAARSPGTRVPVVLAHLVNQGREDAGSQKTYDFSRRTITARWRRGLEDARAMLARLDETAPAADPGLTVLRFPAGGADVPRLAAAA